MVNGGNNKRLSFGRHRPRDLKHEPCGAPGGVFMVLVVRFAIAKELAPKKQQLLYGRDAVKVEVCLTAMS